ncbi:SWR1-complex protein 3 [Candida viswanathii]|uniref:SWR1-complex protein 3 n=1 Tax=Candida viswanathii TaxID=5486 RepID=A0A367XNI3_9ASCO|nr:SWR1-complex protein 3 [Candida viswanathii]
MPPRIRRRITSSKREEIEKEQEELSKTIVRPFDISQSLPVSYSTASTTVLAQPLTVKDSGVLYMSLIKSRNNYLIQCPMFRLYWVKQSSYVRKLLELDKPLPKSMENDVYLHRETILNNDVSARDIMVKLCDAGLSIGPHFFEIRVFIAKDSRLDTKEIKEIKKKEKEEKKLMKLKEKEERDRLRQEARLQREKEKLEREKQKEKEKEEKLKLKQEKLKEKEREKDSPKKKVPKEKELGVKKEGAGVSDLKKDEKKVEKKGTKKEDKQEEAKVEQESVDKEDKTKEDEDDDDESESEDEDNDSDEEGHDETNDSKQDIESKQSTEEPEEVAETPEPSSSKKADKEESTNHEDQAQDASSTKADSEKFEKELFKQAERDVDDFLAKVKTMPEGGTPSAPPTQPVSREPTPSHNLESVENQLMIRNLNSIAERDKPLNALMKVVALGKASMRQIEHFQRYIKRAREMGPPPHDEAFWEEFMKNPIKKRVPKEKKPKPPPKEKKPKKEKPEKPPKEKKEKPEKLPKAKKEKPHKIPKSQIPKDQKLTAFQERYLKDATVLFEFVENPNVRFLLPTYAICEVLSPTTMINAENNDNSDNKDILVSFIWIHNQKEVDEYEKKLEEYNKKKAEEEQKKKEEEEKQKQEEERKKQEEESKKEKSDADATLNLENASNDRENIPGQDSDVVEIKQEEFKSTNSQDGNGDTTPATADEENATEEPEEQEAVPAKRRGPVRRGRKKRKMPPPRKPSAPKPLEPPVEPEYKFSTVSCTIHGIQNKLVPIFVNSVKPLEEVQEKMKHILAVGTRVPSFNLWYQVDGKLDEELAEDIRVQLNLEEKKMTGVPTSQYDKPPEPKKYPKKRKLKEEPKGDGDVKKVKTEGDKDTNNGDGAIKKEVNDVKEDTSNEVTEVENAETPLGQEEPQVVDVETPTEQK